MIETEDWTDKHESAWCSVCDTTGWWDGSTSSVQADYAYCYRLAMSAHEKAQLAIGMFTARLMK